MNPFDYPIALATPRRVTSTSTWVGHLPFAMALVDAARPRTIVELGSFTGESYCAFCQAVQALDLGTRCFAVDTWLGDKHAGFYGHWILEDLHGHHDLFYTGFSTLIQSTFDEALHQFDDGSIDLLHIDGLHTYDAVSHDFEAWRPKLSDRAVVLLHDIVVRREDFGVWKLWASLREQYPSFEFTHSCGLGILCTGSATPAPVLALTRLDETQADRMRTGYARLAQRWSATPSRQLGPLETTLAKMSNLKLGTVPLFVATGQILLSLGDAETARCEFTRALMLDANEPAAHAGMAIALLRLESPEAALAAIGRAKALGSTHVAVFTALASWCAEHDRLTEGLDLVNRALEIAPNDGEALKVRSRLLAAANRPGEASDPSRSLVDQAARADS